MIQNDSLAAELLAASAPAYAAFATNRLIEKLPEVEEQFGASAFKIWRDHFRQRIMELSAAIAEQEPKLFAFRVAWSEDAFTARQIPPQLLRESLHSLKETLMEELPEGSRATPVEFIDAAIETLEKPHQRMPALEPHDANSRLALRYLLAVLEGDGRQAVQLVVDAVDNGLSLLDAYENVLLAAQREVGRMWHSAEVSIAEEHYVTATTQRTMAVLSHLATPQPANGLTVVSAAVAENVHDIGIRAVSDFFEIAGWRAVCLGGDAPPGDIANAVECFNASLVLVSAALTTQLKTVRATIQAIRDISDVNCKIMVGGMAFVDAPEIWERLGADGFASRLADVVDTGTRLVQGQS